MTHATVSLMAQEAAEAPERIGLQAAALAGPLARLGERLAAVPPRAIVTCARGSSDHAALFGKYALENATGLPVASLGPSVVSVYQTKLRFDDMLYVTVSQSGQSPDLIRCAEAARAGGALVVAIVNDCASPLAQTADIALDMQAGPERAVAATKTFLCTLAVLVRLVGTLSGSPTLAGAMERLPDQLRRSFDTDWPPAIMAQFLHAQRAFVIGRGPGLGVAAEMALKLKEVAGLHAEAFSAAEVQHGPKAAIAPDSPVILLGTEDAAQASIEEAAHTATRLGAPAFGSLVAGPGIIDLPTPQTGHPLTQPLIQAASFYRFAESLARQRGLDPDRPLALDKVTMTL